MKILLLLSMKHLLILFPMCFLVLITNSQKTENTHLPLLEVQFLFNDYHSSFPFSDAGKMDAGLGFRFIKGWKSKFDWTIGLSGSFPDSASQAHPSSQKFLLVETDFSLRARLFNPEKRWQPYFQGGIGLSAYHNDLGIFVPAGIGLQTNVTGGVYLLLNAQYRIAATNTSKGHYFYSLGLAGAIGKGIQKTKRKSQPTVAIKTAQITGRDRDQDGILDSVDVCPAQPGLAQFAGCPDTDGDGLADINDNCPTVPGLIKYQGCPIPDKDGDGINDEQDLCPTVPGFAKYQGCPIPDSDKDGVNDEEDSCVNQPGLREFYGCPPINKEVEKAVDLAAKNIFFKTGSYELLPSSFPALDTVSKILLKYPEIELQIEGHTDNVGMVRDNQKLSEQRAESILKYLRRNGVDVSRLTAIGFGEEKPIMDNATQNGRAENRRVELRLQRKK
jgi:OmpA-OmpF porin, OOP family